MLSKETILSNATKFCTGQTDYQNENFVMNSHVTKYRQIRQALLEIENRHHGIRKIKLDVRRDEIKIKALQRDLEKCEDELEAELIRIDIEDLESDNDIRKRKLQRQEIEIDVFVKRVQEEVENEEDIQRYFDQDPEEERKYWIARMGKQAAMDIVSYGRIGSGNMTSIMDMPEEDQVRALEVAVQYSAMIGGGIDKLNKIIAPTIQNQLSTQGIHLPKLEQHKYTGQLQLKGDKKNEAS